MATTSVIGGASEGSRTRPTNRPGIQRVIKTAAPQTKPHEAEQQPDTGGAFVH
jgi:hypothetical protein